MSTTHTTTHHRNPDGGMAACRGMSPGDGLTDDAGSVNCGMCRSTAVRSELDALADAAARRRFAQLRDVMVADARRLADDIARLDLAADHRRNAPEVAVGEIAVMVGNYQAVAGNRLSALIEAAAGIAR